MDNVALKRSSSIKGNDLLIDTDKYPLEAGTLYFTADQELYLDSENDRQQIAGNIIYQDLDNEVNPDLIGTPPTFGGYTVDQFLLKTDNVIPEINISYIEVTSNGTNSINIPNAINDYDNLMVYQNGLLLNENIHYAINSINKTITLIGYYAKQGEIFTFTGPTYANDEVNTVPDSNFSSGVQIKGITLLKNNWTQQKQYSLYLDGVKVSLLSQSIQASPDYESLEEYANCEIKITRQSTNYLYFECSKIPSKDLYVYVIIQESVGG